MDDPAATGFTKRSMSTYIMRKLSCLFAILLSVLFIRAQNTPSWLRYPALSPDGTTIVFTYRGDLYKVPSTGGTAVALTSNEAHDFMPVWSHDGKTIAFASDRYGNFDIFTVPATGGEAKRLTFHSANEYPYDFTAEDKQILFGSSRLDIALNREFPTASQPELYSVPATGGRSSQVLTTPAELVRTGANGHLFLYQDKKGGENEWRKHHTSSITRDIWSYDNLTGRHTRLTDFNGEDRNPVFADQDKTVYYLSESAGSFNVFKLIPGSGSAPQQITHFANDPVRFLSAAKNGTLCFSYNGDIYTKKENGEPEKVSITLFTENKTNNEQVLPVNGGLREMAVSPSGKEVAFVVRGEIFVSSVDGGTTRRITNTPGQERFVSFSPDGRTLLYAAERNNRWTIYQTQIQRSEEPYFFVSTLLKETAVVDNANENYEPVFSPDGKEIAFIENRNVLKILNLASKQVRTILGAKELFSMGDGDQYFTWSPDGKWLLTQYVRNGYWNEEIGLISADGNGKIINLTESGYQDFEPKWSMDGKLLLWFSNRDGLRSYANSGNSQADVYAMFFSQQTWDRFRLSKEEYALLKEQEEKAAKEKKDTTKKPVSVTIDWEGLRDRKARLTIHSSDLADAVVSKDGEKLYYLAKFEKGFNLWTTNLRTKETKMMLSLDADGGSLEWDKEQKNLYLLADGRISKIDPESGKRDAIGINGEMTLDIAAERRFMFEHVWRRVKETFYNGTYHGADWERLKTTYEKFLPHIGNNYEFSEMLSEMLGELNVSHCGARYNSSRPDGDVTASLGAFYDYNYTGAGMKITEVLREGPLDKAGINVKPGMIIEQIDGDSLDAKKDLAQYLNRKAGKNVLLGILDPSTGKHQDILMKPVSPGDESRLLYKRWVKRNEEEVNKLSNGQLGYVHIPGMNDGSYRSAYEEIMGKFNDRKGIIIDTRFNGGGDLVADLATFFTGTRFLDYTSNDRIIGYEPSFRWTKPSVAMANEANYSDGHCFACSYQDLGIGKLIGAPVPGTCTFAGWESLQDRTLLWGVPPLGVKNRKGEWLENHQTFPDVQVLNDFETVSKGKDQQLEKAVEVLLKEIH